jgi:class 3 adenylate cyclase/tetratricopeptide (TPR) repeat protein
MGGVSAPVLCPVMVSREEPLAALEDALLESRRGRGRLVVLAGEAGIGKTRLATELARQARRLGSAVLTGACSEAELALPYLPFVEAIGNYLADAELAALRERLGPASAELSQLFPQFADRPVAGGAGDPGQAQLRLFEAILSLLAVPATDRALLLVIEDVHWADDSSRQLLDHLARRVTAMRALVLVTYRSDELHRRHPFLPMVRAWRRAGLAEVVDLEPLPEAGIAQMVASMTGDEHLEPELIDLLYERTEGNPFFVEEMLTDAAAGLGPDAAIGRAALEEVGIPETVRDTILQRLARLDPEPVAILEAAAVLGRDFDYRTLLAVSGADERAVQAALAAAVSEQLVSDDPEVPGGYRWRHALTQEAIYESIVVPRRQATHSRAADVLATAGSSRPVEVANHLLGAARFEEAVPICLESAGEAERTAAFREAAALLERVLPHVTDPLQHATIVSRIGHDYALNGEPGPAEGLLREGVDALERLGEAREAARYRIVLGRCFWERSRPDLARIEYERARDVLESEGPSGELAMAYVRLAGLAAFELDYQGCLEASRRAVEIAEAAGSDFERVYGLGFLALGYLDAGDPREGFEIMDICYREASEKGYWQVAQNITWNDIWSRIHLLQGGLQERLERFTGMPSVPLINGSLASARAYVDKVRGDLHSARENAELGVGLYERFAYRKMVWRCRVHLAEVLAELGRYPEARAVLPPVSMRTELQDIVYDAPAQIRTRLANDEVDDAVELAREIAAAVGALGPYREPVGVAVEAFVAAGELEAASELMERCGTDPDEPGAPFLDEARGRVLIARGEFAEAAAALRRTVAAAEAAGYSLIALRARVLLARAIGSGGDAEGASSELGDVAATAGRLDARLIGDEARAAADELGIALPEVAAGPVGRVAGPEILPTGERLVTSLFADVRGYTDLSAGDAPAEVAERMAALYRFAKSTVERHGGMVDKFAGDAVMASFNIAGTSVDHVTDAVEAALTLRDKAALMELPVGIGIATGAAILGRGAGRDNVAVTGVATNLAARLQAAAAAGEILLSDEAHRRVESWLGERGLRLEPEALELKGFDSVQTAYRMPAPAPMATASP